MKTLLISFIIMLFSVAGFAKKKQSLFNGKDLTGWYVYVNDTNVDPNKYFYVNNGAIETVGVPAGYLRTQKEYSNYRLHVEWRYPEKEVNSGIMLHVTGPDKIWVAHYQANLKHLSVGDFVVHGVGQKATINGKEYVSTEKEKPAVPKLNPSNEKPAGEWNSYDIACKGNTIEVKVNGLLQNTFVCLGTTKAPALIAIVRPKVTGHELDNTETNVFGHGATVRTQHDALGSLSKLRLKGQMIVRVPWSKPCTKEQHQ